MSGIQNELGPKGFAVVAGTINENPNIPDFINRFHPSFPVGEANRLGAYDYLQMSPMARVYVPYMVFIDRKGMIRSQYTGTDPIMAEGENGRLLREEALKLLNEGAAPAKRPAKK